MIFYQNYNLTKEFKSSWICPTCQSKRPKTNQSNTPVPASIQSSDSSNITIRKRKDVELGQLGDDDDMRLLIREEMFSLLNEVKSHIILQQFDLHTSEVLNRLSRVDESLTNLQHKYDTVKNELDEKANIITSLQSENKELKSTVVSLNSRLSQLEQHSRSSNLEIQCIPEFNSENLFKTIKQIANIVNCNINEADIHVCTRISKLNKESTRPRSVVVKFSSPEFEMSSWLPQSCSTKSRQPMRINYSHLGIAGEKRPVYVGEHLSPMMKAIHAAARTKAKELNYKFVCVRRGTVYMRKHESADYKIIRSIEALSQLEPTAT